MILFFIRSERQLTEQMHYKLLLRWFIGFEMGDAVCAKRPCLLGMAFLFDIIAGDHLISHTVARAVPSAQRGLTSVFGMGTGDPSQYGHRQIEAL